MFSLPPTAIADILANVSDLFATLAPFIALILGFSLAFFVIGEIIGWVREDKMRSDEVAKVLRETDDLLK